MDTNWFAPKELSPRFCSKNDMYPLFLKNISVSHNIKYFDNFLSSYKNIAVTYKIVVEIWNAGRFYLYKAI